MHRTKIKMHMDIYIDVYLFIGIH